MKKTIPVIGMACSVCSANVEKKLQSLEGINYASVSLASRTALVDYDPDIISLEDMKREISNAGYDLVIENDRSVEEILSLIHISEPTRRSELSRMPSSA